MNIKIICVGKIKEDYLTAGINEYLKRLSKYANVQIVELTDEPIPQNPSEKEILKIKETESNKIASKINPSDYVCVLDLRGKQFTSEELSQKIEEITLNGSSTIDFIIGGSLGLADTLVKNANLNISFSKLTFPHQLIRMFLLEQIYRSFKIMHNESYHK